MPNRTSRRLGLLSGLLLLSAASLGQDSASDGERLDVADYNAAGQLRFPDDADRWIALGSGMGGTYPEEGAVSLEQPGALTMVQMEPTAYDYFLEHGDYADGTMLLLQFYAVQQTPEPALQGFVQGQLQQREIHVIDRDRFDGEGRAFFIFPPGLDVASALPVGSACVVCHTEHGALDATFIQFYPAVRHLIPEESTGAE